MSLCKRWSSRGVVVAGAAMYAGMANYQRMLDVGGAANVGDTAVVGNEPSMRARRQGLLDGSATDVWAAVVAVGEDRSRSVLRTTELLEELVSDG